MDAVDDAHAMQLALQQSALAAMAGEVPVGAVVLRDGVVIAVGRNAPIGLHDPTAHAEIVALRGAALALGNYRLDDCELFVTLEPCAMCAGAMLHARLKRLVFGASDPKTGAAGSVLDLFANPQLNHQTQVQGGVLAGECSARLQDFFKQKREQTQVDASPLREDALRTPEARFAQLPDYPWPAHYVSDLPALSGLRMHYLDEGALIGPAQGDQMTYLCLHSSPAWSYIYRQVIAGFLAAGHRVLAPDLIGFGKSDKPKKESAHSQAWHQQVLLDWLERINLKNITLVVQHEHDWLGRALQRAAPQRFVAYLALNLTATPLSASGAYEAPFPDRGHQAALRAFAVIEQQLNSDTPS
jgi:tRNA(adenine34) deaminase